jgi:OmpA-OmpF porin, OOP family
VLKGAHGAAAVADAPVEGGAEAAAPGGDAARAAEAAAPAAETAAPAAGPDFSSDTSPSVAPTEKTMAPKPRPEGLTAEEDQ